MRTIRMWVLVSLFAATAFGATELKFSQTVRISTTAGEAFAEDLSASTGLSGTYSVVSGPDWLSLTERGIVFGTPSEAEIGLHKLYGAVEQGAKTSLFLLEVDVLDPNAAPTLKFEARVDEVFLGRLDEILGEQGEFYFEGTPAWLDTRPNGIMVGKPERADVGLHQFRARLLSESKEIELGIEIRVQDSTPYNPVTVKVGQLFSVDLVKAIGLTGKYLVQAPAFLVLSSTGILAGIPTQLDIGSHRVLVEVRQGLKSYRYYFDLVVEN